MIRKIQEQDKEKFIAMANEFYHSNAVLHSIPEDYIQRTFHEIMSGSPYAAAYVYESNGKIAGYVLLAFTYSNEAGGMVMWIEEIYILPQYQGLGFGKEMFAFLETEYEDKVARIRLEVEDSNRRAVDLYRRIGFADLDYAQMYKDKVK